MPTIKADGHGRETLTSAYHAWLIYVDDNVNTWSRKTFDSPGKAIEYGKRVAERYNRIFGEEAKDV